VRGYGAIGEGLWDIGEGLWEPVCQPSNVLIIIDNYSTIGILGEIIWGRVFLLHHRLNLNPMRENEPYSP